MEDAGRLNLIVYFRIMIRRDKVGCWEGATGSTEDNGRLCWEEKIVRRCVCPFTTERRCCRALSEAFCPHAFHLLFERNSHLETPPTTNTPLFPNNGITRRPHCSPRVRHVPKQGGGGRVAQYGILSFIRPIGVVNI